MLWLGANISLIRLVTNLALVDSDVWLKAETSQEGKAYYAYILVYSDDILIIHEDPRRYMEMLK